ncbi:unnamed protein product [Ophioblennius macclurei]
MEQESTLDFKALRAKFQDEELHLKQPKFKPALPDKPKAVPPPQSPTHFVPAGARPSLLTSINQSIEGKTLLAPRVVFKDDKKDMKKPLLKTYSKKKDKSESKLKGSKDKTKESKEKSDEDSLEQKQKKDIKEKKLSLIFPTTQKENTAELVQATPPPKSTVKKKGLLSLMKSSKKDSVEIPAEPILDTPSLDTPGPAPLIPVPSDFGSPEPEMSVPELLLLNSPALSNASAEEVIPSPTIPESLAFIPPPDFIPDIPEPEIPSTEVEPQLEIKDLDFPVLKPDSHTEVIPSPSSFSLSSPPPVDAAASSPSPPEPELEVEPGVEAVQVTEVETPPVTDPPSFQPSPKTERPISALSALERAEDMSPEKKKISVDQRIFSALQKARRKTTSSLADPTPPNSITPPPEDFPPLEGLNRHSMELPPVDYDGVAGIAHLPAQELVNGINPGQASPELGDISAGLPDSLPEMLVVPPPPPRHSLPALDSLTPEKPDQLPSADLSNSIPSPLLTANGVSFPPQFPDIDTVEVPEFDGVVPDVPSTDIPTQWRTEAYTGPDIGAEGAVPQIYGNGIAVPGTEIKAEPAAGDEHENNPLQVLSIAVPQDLSQVDGPQVENGNGPYESAENMYGDIGSSGTKKKGKSDGGKKRKGPPKNPYVENAQEPNSPNQEKTKTGRFGKTEKKVVVDGPDEKELKKKEKQRLEKEKKELKEKQEREKKEQKEREKKESELKKKFKVTGHEDAIYEANVTVTTKGRKNDLPVKSGDAVSIIRMTNCPKGKWLARDSTNNYGYVAVDHVELDVKEMLELGKKARKTSSNVVEPDAAKTDNRVSNHYPLSGESFEDDSEEWTGDDDEPVSPATEAADPLAALSHTRTVSMPEMPDTANKDLSINHQHSHSDINPDGSHLQAKNEALKKLATFFHTPKGAESAPSNGKTDTSPVQVTEAAAAQPSTEGINLDDPMLILPPPDLYADLGVE